MNWNETEKSNLLASLHIIAYITFSVLCNRIRLHLADAFIQSDLQ